MALFVYYLFTVKNNYSVVNITGKMLYLELLKSWLKVGFVVTKINIQSVKLAHKTTRLYPLPKPLPTYAIDNSGFSNLPTPSKLKSKLFRFTQAFLITSNRACCTKFQANKKPLPNYHQRCQDAKDERHQGVYPEHFNYIFAFNHRQKQSHNHQIENRRHT